MNPPNEHTVGVLNGLIETTFDSADGYEKAAELARNPRVRTLFQARIQSRRQLTHDLAAEVRTYGGLPLEQGSPLGPTHRAFLTFRNKLARNTDKAVIDEVERGENFIRARFEEAARDQQLPADAKAHLERAHEVIRADFDEINALKSEYG